RRLMRLHAGLGDREQALAQYERCRRVLEDELGIAPLAETEALARTLRGAAVAGEAQASAEGDRPAPSARAAIASDGAGMLPKELPFVGRDAEIESLEAAWSDGGMLLVVG